MGQVRAIVRRGDSTDHGGQVLEGFENTSLFGQLIAGKGHKVSCPRCDGVFVIAEGSGNCSFFGVDAAVEGMHTSCGAALIATQSSATLEVMAGGGSRLTSDGLDEDSEVGDSVDRQDGEEIVEQYFSLTDSRGLPVDGYRYDLKWNGSLIATKASLASGRTVAVAGEVPPGLMCWLVEEGASR